MTTIAIKLGPLSARPPRRLVLINISLVLAILLIAFQKLVGGSYPVSISDVFAAVQGQADPITSMIILDHRAPRVLVAIGVGLAFGLAGEMIQTVLRNPLASPDIIGFSAGASTGAIAAVILTGSAGVVFLGAMFGGIVVATAVMALSWNKSIAPGQLVLIGIGVSMTVSVFNDLLMTSFDITRAAEIAKWLVGSLEARDWNDVTLVWIGLLILGPLAFWRQFHLARLALGEDTATVLGISVNITRIISLILALGLVAVAVGTAGPLPFVAFVAGPIAHGLNKAPRPSLLTAGLIGALVTLIADAIAGSLPGGLVLPAGIFTSLFGAPVLIWILILESRKRRI
ncbi:iron chelate uptake ABC transporter family permease subunit [Yoonia sp. BS5-3]|uniref:FecCD family ABC transporter permease n=1 Tax=Yoonia phaeophyticola TaxID=3137369 RepID=A0ABZ2V666_9RHOB